MADPQQFSLNRPTALSTTRAKYSPGSPIAPFLSNLPPSLQRALANYDINRANLGQSPLTNAQTQRAGTALGSLAITPYGPFSTVNASAATPAPDRPWWQDAATDVQQILSAIPKAPALLLEEGAQIPESGGKISAALNGNLSPLETLGSLAQVPGLRLIPGAYVASQFAPGGQGVGGLTEHPVMSLLDVLPYAEKAASLTTTSKVAQDVARQVADTAGVIPPRATPISSVARYGWPGGPRLTERPLYGTGEGGYGPTVPALTPNPIYAALQKIPQTLGGTSIGRFGASAFGRGAREASRLQNRLTSDVEQIVHNPEYISPDIAGPDVTAAGRAAESSLNLERDFADIPADRQIAVAEAARNGTGYDALSPREQELFDTYRAAQEAYTREVVPVSDKLTQVEMPSGNEVYDRATGTRILGARRAADRQLAAANLADTLNPATATRMTPEQILTDFTRAMDDTSIRGRLRVKLARGYVTALQQAGVDVQPLLDTLVANPSAATLRDLPGLVDLSRTVELPTHTLEDITAALAPLRRSSLPVNRYLTAMANGDTSTALREVTQIANLRSVGETLAASGIQLSDLRNLATQRRAVLAAGQGLVQAGFTAKGLRDALATRDRIERGAVPPRFQQVVQNAAIPKMTRAVEEARASGQLTPEAADTVITQVTNRMFRDAANTFPELRDIQREAREGWQDLAAQGYDPIFVHNVTPEAAVSARYPRVADYASTPSQFKARLWDNGARAEPLSVALHHQAVEYLISKGNEAFANEIAANLAIPEAELKSRFLADAQAAHARNPDINLQAHLDQLIGKRFVAWSPTEFITGKVARGAPKMYLPREIATNLERVRAAPSDLAQAFSAPMNLFRTSVLPLSPRWHINNILGGLITTTGRSENPLLLWNPARVRRAWQMARDGGPDSILADTSLTAEERAAGRLAAPGGATRQAGEFFRDRELKTSTEKLQFLNDYQAGRTLRRLFDQGRESRVGRAGAGGIQASYNFNQLFDDFYRSMAYLEGSDRALTRGMSRAEQIRSGVEAARGALQNWDTLTPIERSTMRMVFPFYSWTRFMLKYVMTYPGDHPWRTSILAALSRTEGHDLGTGLPTDLQTLLFLGAPDENGKIRAVNTAGFNPFRDTANYATLAGFLAGNGDISAVTSQVNPLLSTALEWAGVDPASGMADLYPELTYDPSTGKLTAAPKVNPLLGAAGNFLPQLNAVTAFAGLNAEYRDIAARDPQAAGRYLMSTMGVPILSRDVDLNKEVISSEVTRYNQLRTALGNSLRSGSTAGFLQQYPGMSALASRVEKLMANPDFISQYGAVANRPGTYSPSLADVLGQGARAAVPG